jgi:hypothetical protein
MPKLNLKLEKGNTVSIRKYMKSKRKVKEKKRIDYEIFFFSFSWNSLYVH